MEKRETSRAISLLQHLSSALPSDSTICAALSEAGVVYAELESFYSSQQHRGVVRQALASSVRSHLDLYLRDLASVEAEIARTEKLANEGDTASSTLWTIRRLSAWLTRTIARLRALQRIVRSTDSCLGVHIATSVWGCCMTGDPQAKEVAMSVFAAVARPFGLACRNWIRGAAPIGVPLLRSFNYSSIAGSTTDDFFVRDTTPFTSSTLADVIGSSLSEEGRLEGEGGPQRLLIKNKQQRISRGRWGDSSIDRRLVPSFLSIELALEIFRCGRTLRFLQQVCGDEMWVAALGRKLRQSDEHAAAVALLKATSPTAQGLGHSIAGEELKKSYAPSSSNVTERVGNGGNGEAVSSSSSSSSRFFSPTSLNNALQEAHVLGPIGSQRLLQLLRSKFGLLQHLAAVHRYVFLTQGDFVTSLVASISSELSRPAALVSSSKHVLDGIFETAVRATNAHLDDREVLDRVIVTLLPIPAPMSKSGDSGKSRSSGGKMSGWDVFCLEYAFDEPISSIADSDCQVRCGAIFSFLWLLRRCEHELTKAWREQAEVHHSIRGSPDSRVLVEALHKSHLLRSEIAAFVKTLLSHAMFDVLAPAWTQLHQTIENASDMDELIQAYGAYLDAIVEGLFLQLDPSTYTTSSSSSSSSDLSSSTDNVYNRAETQASRAISRILRVALDYTDIQRKQSLLILSAVESKPVNTLEEEDRHNSNTSSSDSSSGASKGKRNRRIVSAVADVKVLAEALVSHAEALEVITVEFRQSVKELFSLSNSSEISISSAERLEAIEARYDSRGFNNSNVSML